MVEDQILPVHVSVEEDGSIITVTFLAGPMPSGHRFVCLCFEGNPMVGALVTFEPGSWWKHIITSDLH